MHLNKPGRNKSVKRSFRGKADRWNVTFSACVRAKRRRVFEFGAVLLSLSPARLRTRCGFVEKPV